MQARKARMSGNLFVDLRIVLHSAASQRIESGIHTEVHLREIRIVAYHVKFAHLRESRRLAAAKSSRKLAEGVLPLIGRQRVSLSSCLGKIKDQFIVVLHRSSSFKYPTIASTFSFETFSVTQKFTSPGSTSTAPKTPIS